MSYEVKEEGNISTVFLNGEIVNSCLIPAAQVVGQEIETIESLADGKALSKIQQAFL